MASHNVKIKISDGSESALDRLAYAWIDPKECVNCGVCREYCPVEAINEQQREVCRICPGCATKPGLAFDEMSTISADHACTIGCPIGISPQGYINLIKEEMYEEAYKLIWEKTPFPAVLGYVCHHPCEDECKRGLLLDEPIKIRALKKYLSKVLPLPRQNEYPVVNEETVAIIGAGPAGLSAAHDLAKSGYEVTVLDSANEAGGMLIRGIPVFRLPREIVRHEVHALEQGGVNFELGKFIGPKQMENLLEEYDAVLVATGTPKPKLLKIEGWGLEGIYSAVDFMERFNNDNELWRHPGQEFVENGEIVVIGCGSVGIDTARAAVRYGAKKVTVVCMERGDQIPAHDWEVDEALKEGVVIMDGWKPIRFVGEQPTLNGVEVIKAEDFTKDDEGNISCKTIPGTEKTIKADMVIEAIGQKADELWDGYRDNDKVFFAGDIQSNDVSVVNAMAAGKYAALEIDGKLQGGQLKDPMELRTIHKAPIEEKIYPATRLKNKFYPIPSLDIEDRVNSLEEVELVLDDTEALAEVDRCLECGYQHVDSEKCIGCGICQKVCPKGGVIKMIRVEKEAEQK